MLQLLGLQSAAFQGRSVSSKPLDIELYEAVKAEAKRKFAVWPSAYASGWLVRTYKQRGGRYEDEKPSGGGLVKWFGEEWVDLARPIRDEDGNLIGYEPCGRAESSQADYPKCRPIAEAMKMTPEEVGSAVARKRAAESRVAQQPRGRAPIMVRTYRDNPEEYDRVLFAHARDNPMHQASAATRLYVVGPYLERRKGKSKEANHTLFLVDNNRLVGAIEIATEHSNVKILASNALEGWGPLLYLSAFTWSYVHNAGAVFSDSMVSQAAGKVWEKFVDVGVASKREPKDAEDCDVFVGKPGLYLPMSVEMVSLPYNAYLKHGPKSKHFNNIPWFPISGEYLGPNYQPIWPEALRVA